MFRKKFEPDIFICYRRNDAGAWAGRLADDLRAVFGKNRVFQDVENIDGGEDWHILIANVMKKCSAIVVVIDKKWVSRFSKDEEERKHDIVVFEIRAAHEQGLKIIPVLVGGAKMPARAKFPSEIAFLSQKQVIEMRDTGWSDDRNRLIRSLQQGSPNQMVIFNRRAIIVISTGTIAALAVLMVQPNLSSNLGLFRRNPRYKAPIVLARHSGPSGWYRNPKSKTDGVRRAWIGHFVRGGHRDYIAEKASLRPATSESLSGTVAGAGKLRGAESKLEPLSIADIPALEAKHLPRLNLRYYSEGIESIAINQWRQGDRDGALETLQIGATYVINSQNRGSLSRLNLRLFDLLAGLLVRAGRESDLQALVAQTRILAEQYEQQSGQLILSNGAKLIARSNRWSDPRNKWRQKWRPDRTRRWNAIDI